MKTNSNPANVFVVMLNDEQPSPNFDYGWLLNLEPLTVKDALRAMQWQRTGTPAGRPEPRMILAKVTKGAPAIMEHKPEGTLRPVLVDRGPYTREAWRNAILTLWGETG